MALLSTCPLLTSPYVLQSLWIRREVSSILWTNTGIRADVFRRGAPPFIPGNSTLVL